MKFLITLILITLITLNINASTQDTLYIYKSGIVVSKRAAIDIDSMTFTPPVKSIITPIDTTTIIASIISTAQDQATVAYIDAEIESCVDYYIANAQIAGFKVKSDIAGSIADSVIIVVNNPNGSVLYYPKTITIDFGTVGVIGKRGNKLTGKIIVILTSNINTANSRRTITFNNFSVNDNAVKGMKTMTSDGISSWVVTSKDTVTTTSGIIISNSDLVRKITEGASTPLDYSDDKYEISGVYSGLNKKGIVYSTMISLSKPLTLLPGWSFFVSGSVNTTSEKKLFDIDYGYGVKDAIATVSYNGINKEISLLR